MIYLLHSHAIIKDECVINDYFVTTYRYYFQPKMVAVFCWAFASGIPLLLVTTTLSARLLQAGIPLVNIGMFAATSLPYALKFIGAPFIERFSIPILSSYFGRIRAWMIVAMIGVLLSLIGVAEIDVYPDVNLYKLFMAACCASFFGAVSDIAEAELRIELLDQHELSLGTACYTNGYCLGELVASGGALVIAGLYDWHVAYFLTASLMVLGIVAVSLTEHRERAVQLGEIAHSKERSIKRKVLAVCHEIFFIPTKSFFLFSGWYWVLLIIIFYYANSYISLMMITPFYLQAGFSTIQIGLLRGLLGTCLLMLGGILGGLFCKHYGFLRLLFFCALFYIFNTLLQVILAGLLTHHVAIMNNPIAFYLSVFTVLFVNLIDGVSVVGYITLMASLCHPPYTATQNALLTSLMAGSKIMFSFMSGYGVKYLGWFDFFILNVVVTVPALFFIIKLSKMKFNS